MNIQDCPYKIIPYRDRFAISNIDGTIIDDAQGYGYKTKQSAYKAAQYKFGGGKDKKKSDQLEVNKFVESFSQNHKINIKKRLFDFYETWFKELARNEVTMTDFWVDLEQQSGEKIDKKLQRQIEKYVC